MKKKLISDVSILLEARRLDAPELMKPHGGTGDSRIQLFIEAIKKEIPLELMDGTKVVVDYHRNEEFIEVLQTEDADIIQRFLKQGQRYLPVIYIKDSDEPLKITDFKKSEYFGGGTASGKAEAVETDAAESLSAVGLAIAVKLKTDIEPSDLSGTNIRKAKQLFDVTSSEDTLTKKAGDKSWAKSTCNIANALLDEFPIMKTGMVFHRGSSWVSDLEKQFNRLNKDPADGSRIFMNINKWNPSDVWAVKSGIKLDKSKLKTLADLNAQLMTWFEQKVVIGISLKKAPKSATIDTYNYDDDLSDILNTSIKELLIGRSNILFKSKSGHILYEDFNTSYLPSLTFYITEARENELEFRSDRSTADVSAAVLGKHSQGGKIGYGQLIKLLKTLGLPTVLSRKEILAKLDKSKQGKLENYYSPVIKEIIRMARTVNPLIAKEAVKTLHTIVQDMSEVRLYQKYQSVQLIQILKSTTSEKKRRFLHQVLQMTMSREELSSVFVKAH